MPSSVSSGSGLIAKDSTGIAHGADDRFGIGCLAVYRQSAEREYGGPEEGAETALSLSRNFRITLYWKRFLFRIILRLEKCYRFVRPDVRRFLK